MRHWNSRMSRRSLCVNSHTWKLVPDVWFCLAVYLQLLSASSSSWTWAAKYSDRVTLRIRNDGRTRMEVGWVDSRKDRTVPMGILEPYGMVQLDTFYGHQLELLELPSLGEGNCQILLLTSSSKQEGLKDYDGCAVLPFSVNQRRQQNILVTDRMMTRRDELLDSVYSYSAAVATTDTSDRLSMCRFEYKKKLKKAQRAGFDDDMTNDTISWQFLDCVAASVTPHLQYAQNEIQFEARVRTTVSGAMENYACAVDRSESTPDIEERIWVHNDYDNDDNEHNQHENEVTRKVHVKFDRPATKIHVIENFASSQECQEMETRVQGDLGRATTADGKGGFTLNENRKAMQAYITSDWNNPRPTDPIHRLNQRIFDYANYALGLNLTGHGQESLMSIQYFGRGEDDLEPDRYNSHCDGFCQGDPLVHASRIATMVIYCTIPSKGGQTNFQNAGVTIKPEFGNAIFFSYVDPITKITDRGFSQHSGCSVYEGEKKIITQWIRLGVTKELTSEHYNSLDILIDEDGE